MRELSHKPQASFLQTFAMSACSNPKQSENVLSCRGFSKEAAQAILLHEFTKSPTDVGTGSFAGAEWPRTAHIQDSAAFAYIPGRTLN